MLNYQTYTNQNYEQLTYVHKNKRGATKNAVSEDCEDEQSQDGAESLEAKLVRYKEEAAMMNSASDINEFFNIDKCKVEFRMK